MGKTTFKKLWPISKPAYGPNLMILYLDMHVDNLWNCIAEKTHLSGVLYLRNKMYDISKEHWISMPNIL